MERGTVITGDKKIRLYQLLAAKQAIKLEAKGLRFKGSRSVKGTWAIHFGMGRCASHLAVIARIEAEAQKLAALIAEEGGAA